MVELYIVKNKKKVGKIRINPKAIALVTGTSIALGAFISGISNGNKGPIVDPVPVETSIESITDLYAITNGTNPNRGIDLEIMPYLGAGPYDYAVNYNNGKSTQSNVDDIARYNKEMDLGDQYGHPIMGRKYVLPDAQYINDTFLNKLLEDNGYDANFYLDAARVSYSYEIEDRLDYLNYYKDSLLDYNIELATNATEYNILTDFKNKIIGLNTRYQNGSIEDMGLIKYEAELLCNDMAVWAHVKPFEDAHPFHTYEELNEILENTHEGKTR